MLLQELPQLRLQKASMTKRTSSAVASLALVIADSPLEDSEEAVAWAGSAVALAGSVGLASVASVPELAGLVVDLLRFLEVNLEGVYKFVMFVSYYVMCVCLFHEFSYSLDSME